MSDHNFAATAITDLSLLVATVAVIGAIVMWLS
jgi:hypothetical protein